MAEKKRGLGAKGLGINALINTEVQKNGKVLGKEQYSIQKSELTIKDELAENETVEYTVKAIINKIPEIGRAHV